MCSQEKIYILFKTDLKENLCRFSKGRITQPIFCDYRTVKLDINNKISNILKKKTIHLEVAFSTHGVRTIG
jgi:hypothetical protein